MCAIYDTNYYLEIAQTTSLFFTIGERSLV